MRYWHHACTSWNGKTGEWQIWVKAERVGRGFHNRVSWPNFKRLQYEISVFCCFARIMHEK